MRPLLRWLTKALIIWLVLCIDRVMGVPILFLIVAVVWGRHLMPLVWVLWCVYCSILVMSLFDLSWLLALAIIMTSSLWVKYGQTVLPSVTMRLIISAVVGSLVLAWLAAGVMGIQGWIYLLLVIVTSILTLKRERLQLHPARRWRQS